MSNRQGPPRGATIQRDAVFSDDREYRYLLHRKWADTAPLNVIMLNPSVADESVDDNTIRRVMGFAAREGFGDVFITNIFALRSTNPKAMRTHENPVGYENDTFLFSQAGWPRQVWVAWGSDPMCKQRVPWVRELLDGIPLLCLGVNRDGMPKHPLYLANDTPLVPWGVP